MIFFGQEIQHKKKNIDEILNKFVCFFCVVLCWSWAQVLTETTEKLPNPEQLFGRQKPRANVIHG